MIGFELFAKGESVKLFVFHTPELTPTDAVPDCAIAIDVLRATTTIASVLANGAATVRAFKDIDQLLECSNQLPETQRVRAGGTGWQAARWV